MNSKKKRTTSKGQFNWQNQVTKYEKSQQKLEDKTNRVKVLPLLKSLTKYHNDNKIEVILEERN